jgi:hypothetical protein
MDSILAKAYEVLFDGPPSESSADWQLAKAIVEHFDVQKLHERLAKQCIHRIVNYTYFPTADLTTEVVYRAEGLASELWDDLSDEPHMAELERKEFLEIYADHRKRIEEKD